MSFCTTMIVRLTSFTSSRLLITKSANLAIVLASDFHWYIVRPTKKQNQFCMCSSWTDMTRISADFCQHVWWLPLAFEWSYVPWCFTLSFQCQIMMIATANLRVLPVFECLLKTRGKKTFPRPTTYPSLLTLKVIINIILLHSRDILFFEEAYSAGENFTLLSVLSVFYTINISVSLKSPRNWINNIHLYLS